MVTTNFIINTIQKFSWILTVLILIFGWTSPVLMVIALLCMLGPIVFAFTYGRAWCGNFCPRGSLSSTVLPIISPQKKIPKFFKNLWFRSLVLIFVMAIFIYGLSQPHSTLTCLGSLFIKMMTITTIVQIFLAVLIHHNAWCNLCPMGTFAHIITKIKKGKSSNVMISNECMSCNICSKKCPVQVNIPDWREFGEIKDADCTKCRKCIATCPKGCLKYGS